MTSQKNALLPSVKETKNTCFNIKFQGSFSPSNNHYDKGTKVRNKITKKKRKNFFKINKKRDKVEEKMIKKTRPKRANESKRQ